ncbi:MAG: hypothetical protein EBS41_01325 [Actinobacteria bacterium]|nr:hypothetical protein [Actinomycetota bacterium]
MKKSNALGTLHVGTGLQFGPLTVFPVWTDAPIARGFSTARRRNIQVSELDPPTVPRLIVSHELDTDVLLLEGTMLVGGWQTRVAACDVVIPRGERVVVDVRCVEAGRWQGGRGHGVDGMAPMSVKVALRGGQSRMRHADQSEVWQKVSRLERFYGTKSTNSLHELMNDSITRSEYKRADGAMPTAQQMHLQEESLPDAPGNDIRGVDEQVLADLRAYARSPLPGQRGIIIGIGGVPVCLELYGSATACRAELLPTLTAALLDAGSAEKVGVTRGQAARDFAKQCALLSDKAMWDVADLLEGASETTRDGDDDIDLRGLRRSDTKTLLHFSALNMKHELALAM